MQPLSVRSVFLATSMCVVATSCGDAVTTSVPHVSAHASIETGQPNLLTCSATAEHIVTAMIGPRGGSIGTAQAHLRIPPGAVPRPTEFTLRVPSSRAALVQITATGVEHYRFLRPVSGAISYRGCNAARHGTLRVWLVDDVTHAPLEAMSTRQDAAQEIVTFSTTHLSTYAVAF